MCIGPSKDSNYITVPLLNLRNCSLFSLVIWMLNRAGCCWDHHWPVWVVDKDVTQRSQPSTLVFFMCESSYFKTQHFITRDKTTPSHFLMTTMRRELKCHQHAALKAMKPFSNNLLFPQQLYRGRNITFFSFRRILSTIIKMYPENVWPNSNPYIYI